MNEEGDFEERLKELTRPRKAGWERRLEEVTGPQVDEIHRVRRELKEKYGVEQPPLPEINPEVEELTEEEKTARMWVAFYANRIRRMFNTIHDLIHVGFERARAKEEIPDVLILAIQENLKRLTSDLEGLTKLTGIPMPDVFELIEETERHVKAREFDYEQAPRRALEADGAYLMPLTLYGRRIEIIPMRYGVEQRSTVTPRGEASELVRSLFVLFHAVEEQDWERLEEAKREGLYEKLERLAYPLYLEEDVRSLTRFADAKDKQKFYWCLNHILFDLLRKQKGGVEEEEYERVRETPKPEVEERLKAIFKVV